MLRGEELRKVYTSGIISVTKKTAVDRVSISIGKGETIAIVGESGCGKSTLVKMLTMQLPATEGEVYFSGEKLTGMKWKELRQHIVKFQMIPQNPDDAVDPRWELGRSVAEPLVLSGKYSREEIAKIVPELLAEVGLGPEFMSRFPHQVSGGELQRIVIARALALKPDLLICDEATSMLDVSVQSYIMSLLKDIQKKRNIALIIITHDLVFANAVANLTYVMFGEKFVEIGEDVFAHPLHPYTQALWDAAHYREMAVLPGEKPPIPEEGCRYYDRCAYRDDLCKEMQVLRDIDGRKVRCVHPLRDT